MAKVQAYVSDEVADKINAIVEKRRVEGAKDKDISFSSISTMLLELGLRVYEAQMERKESGFNQMAFNKALLESVIKTQFTVNKVLGIECLSPHVSENPRWEWPGLIENIRDDVQEVMLRFFPDEESEDEE
ncbi:conjugal transfer relaxosome DNA-binding protein TraM [Klebsiella pneumoniae]|uniref:conjugal transfer relaxosome DNA-binding protein TraM n=1 Tax=Klebsiella pneumoniae TaxID=573 RepID=UPI0021672ECB|nr:conjugal transfer relaxosome DNA-binding protein TraM [Klebsiella pneumoniae]MCS4367115.1 relaxosome protein TraM [Klebsiella pneumoniae]